MSTQNRISALSDDIRGCKICADRFAATGTGHVPRPVAWLSDNAPILLAGQAPGARVHASGIPFDDPSGDRLRDWLGVDREVFYDRANFAILPMAFCFPGYKGGSDLPPPTICAETWRERTLDAMPQVQLTVLIGGYAQKWHMKTKEPVAEIVSKWEKHLPDMIPLPHPSWRNTAWLKKHPWFEADAIPWLRSRVRELLKHV